MTICLPRLLQRANLPGHEFLIDGVALSLLDRLGRGWGTVGGRDASQARAHDRWCSGLRSARSLKGSARANRQSRESALGIPHPKQEQSRKKAKTWDDGQDIARGSKVKKDRQPNRGQGENGDLNNYRRSVSPRYEIKSHRREQGKEAGLPARYLPDALGFQSRADRQDERVPLVQGLRPGAIFFAKKRGIRISGIKARG